MKYPLVNAVRVSSCMCCLCYGLVGVGRASADNASDTSRQIEELRLQNQAMQDQLRHQQELIDALTRKMGALEKGQRDSSGEGDLNPPSDESGGSSKSGGGFNLGQVRISGEGGVGFFHTGSEGMFPNDEFRVDEARLFVEAPVWGNTYFYGELNLATREEPDVEARLGELYLEFENVSELWDRPRMLNVRVGRMYTPFGEEYETRYAIDNPLISHSLSDLWAVDEGVEIYGKLGPVRYAAAVQNGGIPDTRDFNSDKTVAGRLEYDPASWLHLSASGMRTGDLSVNGDQLSAMWFGSGFFRSIGSPNTTRFHANLAEGDIQIRIPKGHLGAFGGYIRYGDNDPLGNNGRDVYYYSIEAVSDLTRNLYVGGRFSQIFADGGFPIVADGTFGDYL
ncbi:MAG: hypothetical protein ACREIC_09405, partial [Limisphaerales bacterium]